jgi:hypothetical protein
MCSAITTVRRAVEHLVFPREEAKEEVKRVMELPPMHIGAHVLVIYL